MSVQLLDPTQGGAFSALGTTQAGIENDLTFEPRLPIGGDGIARFQPPNPAYGSGGGLGGFGGFGSFGAAGPSGSSLFGQLGSLLQQLGALLQQLMGGGFGSSGCGAEQYFQNANGASTGDPHLSFNGSTWDNMQSQPNLLGSDSFPGGYRISTQATAPNASGVTYNQSATVTSNYGMTSVSLDKSGVATITQNGANVPIQPGQTLQLGNGESVTQNQNGSLAMTSTNGNGGTISTTLSLNGNGVDVQTTASNVDLTGALVNGPNASSPAPPLQRW
jgi:hypothetical protein